MPEPQTDDELSIYVDRMMRFIQLLKIYELVLSIPEEQDPGDSYVTMKGTMMGIVYSFYYSLIERSSQGIDFFRIWRARVPEMEEEIATLERQVEPMRDGLRLLRNRFGFHGSISRDHEIEGMGVLRDFDGRQVMEAMIATRNLSTRLISEVLRRGEARDGAT